MSVFKRVEITRIDTDAALKIFGDAIVTARKKRKLTQDDLAKKIEVSRTQITNLEVGRTWVSVEVFIRLVTELDLTISKEMFL